MAYNYSKLNKENAFIWRIVHRDNLPWIIENGIHCSNSKIFDPNYINIGNSELIDRRATRIVPINPKGTLSDYIPFYFTPFSPMMYNIYTGRGSVVQRKNEEICILVSSLHNVHKLGLQFIFTDRHAYPPLAQFKSNLADLDIIDWPLLQARNFQRSPEEPVQIERYQAEALIYQFLPINALKGIICYQDDVKKSIETSVQSHGLKLDIQVLPKWYF